jgi:MoxR-like ATPase
MKRRYWVISPNVQNDGKVDYWLKRSIDERKVFVGYDNDKKHGITFENTLNINDCVIIAKGAKDDRKLYLSGLISSPREYDEEDEIFYRDVDYLIDEKDFEEQSIELNSYNAWGESSNPGTIYELKKSNEYDILVIDKINTIIKLKLDMKSIEERIGLLEYKKQIILQGPPGTGKTRLAKEIAKEITKQLVIQSPLDKINVFLKGTVKASPETLEKRKKLEGYLKEFQQIFKKEDIGSLSLEKYSFGNGTNDSFCWWIEYGLYELGGYTGQAGKFKIYWKKSNDVFFKIGFIKDVEDDNEAMKLVAEQLNNVVNEKNLDQAAEKLSKGFILKILHSYYPEKYFPINNEKCINNALKILGKQFDGLNIFEKNIALQKAFEEKRLECNADITNYEFMGFLFVSFDMKGNIQIQKEGLISKGEYKIIQFHPAYSYEDFVRGITAETNKNSQVEYKVVNKILSDFAQKALDNPSVKYVLIIDEINRANLPSVLGELIYALDYRYDETNADETTVESMYALKQDMDDEEGDTKLKLPKNLYIIGTMNTADRSVGHIDYAIRRRFAFVDVLPKIEPVHPLVQDVFKKVSELFIKNFDQYQNTKEVVRAEETLASDFRPEDVWIGHSYFICKKENSNDNLSDMDAKPVLTCKLKYEVLPILIEYIKDGILQDNEKTKKVLNELTKWS